MIPGRLFLSPFPMEVRLTNSAGFSCRDIDELASWTYDFNFIPHPPTNPFGHKEDHSDDDGRKESHSDFRNDDQ
jgi:hypothetical protein